MTGLRSLTSVSTLATLLIASMVSAAPIQSEAGLLLSKRGSFSGDGTYYNPGLGACGKTNTASQLIAAINAPQFGGYSRPSDSPVCHSCAMVTGPLGSVKVKIVDKCPSCKFGSLDLSPAAFKHIADLSQGRVPITWDYVSCGDESASKNHDNTNTNTSAQKIDTNTEKPVKDNQKPSEHNAPAKTEHSTSTKTEEHIVTKATQNPPVKTPKPNVSIQSEKESNHSSTPKPSKQEDHDLLASTSCDFIRRCVSPGLTGQFETCSNGKIDPQVCAQGTVCKADAGDIICTWA